MTTAKRKRGTYARVKMYKRGAPSFTPKQRKRSIKKNYGEATSAMRGGKGHETAKNTLGSLRRWF